MKKTLLITLALSLVSAGALSAQTWEEPQGANCVGVATHAETPPTIDGVVGDGEWDINGDYVYGFGPITGRTAGGTDGLSANWMAQWDETYLYLLVWGTDSALQANQQGNFELYISTNYTRMFGQWAQPGYDLNDVQLRNDFFGETANTFVHGMYSDQSLGLSSYTRATTISGSDWVSEVRVSWDDLGGLPLDIAENYVFDANPDYLGFEVHIQRGTGDNRTKLAWCYRDGSPDGDKAWANTEVWGTLRLMSGGITPPPPPPNCEESIFQSAYNLSWVEDCWFWNGFFGYLYGGFENTGFIYAYGTEEAGTATGWYYIVALGSSDEDGLYIYDFQGTRWGFTMASIYPFAEWY